MSTALACSGELEPIGSGGTGGGTGGSGGAGGGTPSVDAGGGTPGVDAGGGTPGVDPQMLYTMTVDPIWDVPPVMTSNTCRGCHQEDRPNSTPPFFLGFSRSDNYTALTVDNVSLLGSCDNPAANPLGNKGLHSGDALNAMQQQAITDWITAWCASQ